MARALDLGDAEDSNVGETKLDWVVKGGAIGKPKGEKAGASEREPKVRYKCEAEWVPKEDTTDKGCNGITSGGGDVSS